MSVSVRGCGFDLIVLAVFSFVIPMLCCVVEMNNRGTTKSRDVSLGLVG